MNEALKLKARSIAFPLLGTGAYKITKEDSMEIALNVFQSFLIKHSMDIYLVVFDSKSYELSRKLFHDIETFIDENYVRKQEQIEYLTRKKSKPSSIDTLDQDSCPDEEVEETCSSTALDDFIRSDEKTFQEKLFEIIDQKNMKDSDVYNKVYIDRRLFSKIRSNIDYKPSKKTAFALCISLELDIDQATDLLNRSSLAFSPSDKYDLVVKYYIMNHIYDIDAIDNTLYDYGLDTFV